MRTDKKTRAKALEKVLSEYGFHGTMVDVKTGPVVTFYEFEPSPGTKSSRIINLSEDFARSMSALSCRVSVVPGKNLIGFELPNAKREVVLLNELLETDQFKNHTGKLPVVLGKNITGEPVIADIAKMPHLLVAGTTGSGKSVGINTMIVSLLNRMTPKQLRFIMIDPKMLEFAIYRDIPHLLVPVVTESQRAVKALEWAVDEMVSRYEKMSQNGVRNISGFNEKMSADKQLPYIVIVIDEVADLMMVAGKEVEMVVQRLAQMARAAGIHVIMATQRPSVDVITGTIKANFPTRISFKVTSKIDSRTILGEQGAEQLLGAGDMLVSGGSRLERVHGAFITDQDIETLLTGIKAGGKPSYVDIFGDNPVDNVDPAEVSLYDRAKLAVLIDGLASVRFVQRKLGIGYFHAKEIIQRMEIEGLVSPLHEGKREVFYPND